MRQWLITILRPVVAAAALAGVAHAGVVTCANDFDLIPANTYMVAGRITPSSSYATGGETFSASNSLADVGACLCHSNARKPLVVIVEGQKGGFLYDFDHVNLKLRILFPVFITNGATGPNVVSASTASGGTTILTAPITTSAGESGVELGNGFSGLNSATFTVRFIALCS